MRFISKLARHSSITLHGVFGGVGLSSAGNLNQLLFVTMFSDCKWLRSAVAVRLSSGLSTLLVLFLVELDGTSGVLHGGGHLHGLLSFTFESSLGHLEESLFDLGAFECTGFVEHHIVVLFSPCLSLGGGHLPVLLLIQFVSEADEREVGWVTGASIFDESLLPFVETVVRIEVSDIVTESATVSSTVESVSKRLELLLTSSIPDL